MRRPAQPDTATAPTASARKHPEVTRHDDLVWPPPAEDLRAFTVVKLGEGDEQEESLLIVAGLSAKASIAPSAPAAAPAPLRRAAEPAPAMDRSTRPAPTRPADKTRGDSRVIVFRPPPASPRIAPRWFWLAPVFAAFAGRTSR
jgi:hypothetical protein